LINICKCLNLGDEIPKSLCCQLNETRLIFIAMVKFPTFLTALNLTKEQFILSLSCPLGRGTNKLFARNCVVLLWRDSSYMCKDLCGVKANYTEYRAFVVKLEMHSPSQSLSKDKVLIFF